MTVDPGFSLQHASKTLTFRFFAVGALALLMTLPLSLIQDRIRERSARYDGVVSDIASGWGRSQTLVGPVLLVPYLVQADPAPPVEGQISPPPPVPEERMHVVLPRDLSIRTQLEPQRLHRGIQEAVVYTATATLSGSFEDAELPAVPEGSSARFDWARARVLLGLSEPGAIAAIGPLDLGSASAEFLPGSVRPDLVGAGFHAAASLSAAPSGFSMRVVAKGSGLFAVAPIGRVTTTEVSSSWPHPNFRGSPTSRQISAAGFEGLWEHSHLTSTFPRQFDASTTHDLGVSAVGVELIEPVALYSKITRATKYGLLFVSMTFLVLLLFELAPTVQMHPVQYGLVGLALSLFYLTLLSFAEQTAFAIAYVLAASIVIAMVGLYVWAALSSARKAGTVGAVLAGLYGVLFAVLRMEDLALLAGTTVLLVATSITMYLTRHLARVGAPA